jgi:hypothetical protein
MDKSIYEKYLVRKPLYELFPGIKNRQSPAMTFISNAQIPGAGYCLYYSWIYGIPEPNPPVAEEVYDTEKIILYFGGDSEDPEDLGAEIEFRIGGQSLTFSKSAGLYVPRGVRHSAVWKKFKKPHIEMVLIPGDGPDKAGSPASGPGKQQSFENSGIDFEKYLVRKPIYERSRGVKNRQSPTMTFMSSAQVPEANYYIEFGWVYGIPDPNPSVTRHVHQQDEIALHFGGDWNNPEDLGGEIDFGVENDFLVLNTSCAFFAPRGLYHCPVIWKKWSKPHIEMAITLGCGTR